MIKYIAIAAATAFALTTMTASACPLQDAKKAAAEKKAGTSQPAQPSKPTV